MFGAEKELVSKKVTKTLADRLSSYFWGAAAVITISPFI